MMNSWINKIGFCLIWGTLFVWLVFGTAIAVFGQDFYTARELINEDKYEEALVILRTLNPDENEEVLFYLGVVYEGTLDNKMAIACYSLFLESDCETERLRYAANTRLQNLLSIQKGTMADVHQKMQYASRKLSLEDTGEDTQREQKNAIAMLEKMIKEQEKSEASNNQSQNTKKHQEQSSQNTKKEATGESNTGGNSNQPNGKAKIRKYNGPQSPWSLLRDKARDPALQSIKEKLPPRYREIVERYYEKANGPDR
jgi:hypothetical protein